MLTGSQRMKSKNFIFKAISGFGAGRGFDDFLPKFEV
jgi:hypothetical protein